MIIYYGRATRTTIQFLVELVCFVSAMAKVRSNGSLTNASSKRVRVRDAKLRHTREQRIRTRD